MSVPEERLSDILSGKDLDDDAPEATGETTDKVDAAPPAAGSKDKVDEKPASDKGTAKAGDDTAAAAKTDDAQAPKVEAKSEVKGKDPLAAIIELRRRTQAAENRVRELEGQGKGEKPSVLVDEDGAFNSRIDEGTRGLREQNYHLSVKLARMEHKDDFAAAEEAFAQAAETDDRLIAALRASADPGEYIYTVGLQIKELADVGGDFVKYREKITTESRAQISERDTRIKALEAQVAELTKQKTDLETLPRSLNSKPPGAPASGEEDEEELGSIVRFGKKSR